jgi:hypothetical protein
MDKFREPVPEYRIERDAASAEIMQAIGNVARQLVGLPVLKTAAQAAEEERRSYRHAEHGAPMHIIQSENASPEPASRHPQQEVPAIT